MNTKLLEQLTFGFKRTFNWEKLQSKKSAERQNQYSNYLIDLSFSEINTLFALSLEDEAQRTSYKL